jgi:hypothetical protein
MKTSPTILTTSTKPRQIQDSFAVSTLPEEANSPIPRLS